jgi:EAL domain-containing protein (putative c-di-GMP-specific phosphodiesterase class I)
MPTTAEGIETQEQLDFVRVCGCTHAQGFLLGKPARGKDIPHVETGLAAHSVDKD